MTAQVGDRRLRPQGGQVQGLPLTLSLHDGGLLPWSHIGLQGQMHGFGALHQSGLPRGRCQLGIHSKLGLWSRQRALHRCMKCHCHGMGAALGWRFHLPLQINLESHGGRALQARLQGLLAVSQGQRWHFQCVRLTVIGVVRLHIGQSH